MYWAICCSDTGAATMNRTGIRHDDKCHQQGTLLGEVIGFYPSPKLQLFPLTTRRFNHLRVAWDQYISKRLKSVLCTLGFPVLLY